MWCKSPLMNVFVQVGESLLLECNRKTMIFEVIYLSSDIVPLGIQVILPCLQPGPGTIDFRHDLRFPDG